MYIFHNAMRNILRSKGRNILIGLIVLVIAVASCLALSIREAAVRARADGLDALEITAQITLDRQAMMQDAQNAGGDIRDSLQDMGAMSLSLDEMQTYAASTYVKSFTYTLTTSVNAGEGLQPIDTSGTSEESETTAESGGEGAPPDMPEGGGGRGPMAGMGEQGDFTLIGYSGEDAMTSFLDQTCQVTEGTVFEEGTAEAVCIVSDELATLNGLAVGDTIQLVNPNDEEEILTFTISGIYHNSAATAGEGGMMQGFSAASDPANQIYTSYTALKFLTDASAANAETSTDEETGRTSTTALREQVAGVYHFAEQNGLSAAENYEAFQEDAVTLGLPENYTVTSTDVEAYEQSLLPLENLSQFAAWFLLVVLLIGGVILVVFHIFNIRERKYEIGVLAAIGIRKGKVALQFLAELFTVTFVFLLIGTAIGAAVSVPVTNALLSSQIASQESQQSNREMSFGRPGGGGEGGAGGMQPPDDAGGFGGGFQEMGRSMANYLDEVTSATDWVVVAQLLGIGLLLTLLSACVAVAFVLRYEPLKILSERT